MTSAGTLWTVHGQAAAKPIRAAAALAGIKIDIPGDYKHFEDNKKDAFLSKFPHGKIPGWVGADGTLLFESVPIARYIAGLAPQSGLLGNSPKEAALVDQWIHHVETEVDFYTYQINNLVRGSLGPYSKPIHTAFLERQARGLATLNTHLTAHTFFVGERITLADLVVAALIQRAALTILDTPARAKYQALFRHLETVINQPALLKAGIFDPTPELEVAKAYVAPAKEAKPAKEPKPAQAPKPKAEKKEKPKEDDEEEDDVPAEPKVRNPLDDLPKSTFNLEDWKRAYSNKETRGPGGAIEWFYENYDPVGFSIYRVDFKYPTELTQTFMSSNQIGGFFARLEASRKYLFGSVGVLGSANNSLISGVFILRGQDAVPVVSAAPDWESYEFKKLDLGNGEDKKFFEAALAWDLEVEGKKWADGKNFK